MVAMQQVLLNDFKRQWLEISQDVLGAVDRVGSSGWYVLGGEVRDFESALSAHWGVGHAIGVASGLDAIEIALRSAGLAAGDAVLTTPLSAFATTLAIVRSGGRPVFCETGADGLLDLAIAEEILTRDRTIRFMVPVHLFGQSLDLDRLADLQERLGVTIIEDCAQSIGARWNGRATGTVGVAAATSFYPTKNLGAMGDGGAVLTDDANLAERVRQLRDYGQSAKYRHDRMGWNSRLDELHAAILRDAVLPRLAHWTNVRQQVARQYEERIQHPQVRLIQPGAGSQGCGHLFPVWVEPGRREHFEAWLKAGEIGSGRHYPVLIPDQRAMIGVPHEVHGELAQARQLADGEVSLPIHPQLTQTEVDRVITRVNTWVPAP